MRFFCFRLGLSFLLVLVFTLFIAPLAWSVVGDSYEPDNSNAEATTLTPDGTLYSHTFEPWGDEDWHKFEATKGTYYTIETLNVNGAVTFLKLYDTDGLRLLNEAGPWSGREWGAAMINWQCPADGVYFILCKNYFEAGGSYDIRVTNPGSISGTVTDETGANPLEAVNVYLYNTEGFEFFGTGYTDLNGDYIIQQVPVGNYYVKFDPSEHNIIYDADYLSEFYNNWHGDLRQADIVSVGNGQAVTEINAQLEVGSRVYGTVKNSSGEPLEDISIYVYNNNNWFWAPSTNYPVNNYVVHGVPTGTYRVFFDPSYHNENNDSDYLFEWYNNKRKRNLANTITIASNRTRLGDINAILEVGSRIQGVIKDQAGNLLSWVFVELRTEDYGWFNYSYSDKTGKYVLRGVPTGYFRLFFDPSTLNDTYRLDYLAEWYNNKRRYKDANLVYVGSSGLKVKINPILERAARVYGTVTGEHGECIAGVSVLVFDIDYNFEGLAVTDSGGNYLISNPLITDGYHKILFDTAEHNYIWDNNYITEWYGGALKFEDATPVELKAGLYKRLDAVLSEGGCIYGYVNDATGRIPLENTRLQLYSEEYDYWSPGAFVDSDGAYVIRGIAPGKYRLFVDPLIYNYFNGTSFMAEWYNEKTDYESADPILIDYGDMIKFNFALDVGGSIEGTVTAAATFKPLGDVVVSVLNEDGEEVIYELTDSNGHYIIRGVPPGDYKVKFDPVWHNFFYDSDFTPEWYDDKLNFTQATIVTVEAETVVSGIDATLDYGGRVTGTLRGEDGKGLASWASISLYSLDDSQRPAVSFWSDDECNWVARGVPPGNYRVFFDISDYNSYFNQDYISEWYNDASTFSLATTITVESTTSVVTGINGVLEKIGKVASTGLKADVNGDGKADTVVLYDKGNQTCNFWVFLSNGSKFTPKLFWSSLPGGWDAARTKITAGDVNHDGKVDIIALYDHKYKTSALYVFISSGSKFTPKLFWKSGLGAFDYNRSKLSAGDVNRDGRADAIILYDYRNKTTGLFAFISSGSSFSSKLWWKSKAGSFDARKATLSAGDLNADGKVDAITFFNYGSNTSGFRCFISSGSSFASPDLFWKSSAGKFNYYRSNLAP